MRAHPPLFVAVEVGTTGARAVGVDLQGHIVAEVRCPYTTSLPRPGWAEQDARDWSDQAIAALAGLASRIDTSRVRGIGLTGQSPTVVALDAAFRPLRPGMLYRDNRAVVEAALLRDRFGDRVMHRRTGHRPAAFHIAPKLLWLRANEPAVFARTRWFLQPRDVVLHRLTGQVATDETHANVTLLFDLRARHWATDLFDALGLDVGCFPAVRPSWEVAGDVTAAVSAETGIAAGTPVVTGAGDSQCVAFGADVVAPGAISEMAGASSCINSAVTRPRADLRITHFSHVVPRMFSTEVGLNTTGAAIRWAVEHLGFASYDDLAAAAAQGRKALLTGDVDPLDAAPLFVTHLGDGERDDPAIRGGVVGLSDRHDRAALAYAVLEGVAFSVGGEVALLAKAGCPVEELRVAGGGTRLPLLGQLKADVIGAPVAHLDVDASATGAALLAARAVGEGDEAAAAIAAVVRRATRFEPDPAAQASCAQRRAWFVRSHRGVALRRGAEAAR